MHLDYIVAPPRPVWAGVLVLALSLGLAGDLWVRYRDVQLEAARLATAAGMAGARQPPARALPKARLDDETKAAEAVVRQLTLPWGPLIASLEQAATRDVAILQLQPDAQQRVLKLTAEAQNEHAMFAYVRRLGAASALGEAHLVSHQVLRDEPQRPIQFSIQATLKGAR